MKPLQKLKRKLRRDIKASKRFIRNMSMVGHEDYVGFTYGQVADLRVREQGVLQANEATLKFVEHLITKEV